MNVTDFYDDFFNSTTDVYGSTTDSFDNMTDFYNGTSTIAPEVDVDFRTWLFDTIMQRTAEAQGNFWKGFIASISVVIVSELGDKTFFIAAIMAMKHPRVIVFAGAISALVFMTILSAAFGWIATVIPRVYTYYISAALFAIFGIKMLRDGWKMDPNEGQEELEEVQSELKKREEQGSKRSNSPTEESETISDGAGPSTAPERAGPCMSPDRAGPSRSPDMAGPSRPPDTAPDDRPPGPSSPISEPQREDKEETVDMLEQGQAEVRRKSRRNALLKVLLQAATLTFLAEWGDRSQLATVVLASREDALGVIVGGSLGHALCTGLAVIGGRMVAQKISVRTVTIIGGIVFLGFAVSALFIGPGD